MRNIEVFTVFSEIVKTSRVDCALLLIFRENFRKSIHDIRCHKCLFIYLSLARLGYYAINYTDKVSSGNRL